MKKGVVRWVAVAVLVLVELQGAAQGFYGGGRGGMNVSTLTKTAGSAAVRGNFGGFMGFQFGSFLGLQVEALYSFQGGMVTPYGTPREVDVQLDYLKFPILAKIYLYKGLNIEAGVSFNILTSALVEYRPAKGYNGFDFSIPVGVAYQFGKHFEVGARYDISTVAYHPNQDGLNSLFSFNVAWRF